MNKMYNLYCSECDSESNCSRLGNVKDYIYCSICKTTTEHETRKKLFCNQCATENIVSPLVEGELYCPICLEGTEHVEMWFDPPLTEYECERCGYEIKHKDDSYNILTDCPGCGKWSNFNRKDDMSRKKHRKRQYHNEKEFTFFCQDCNERLEITGHHKHTIALWRYCKDCKKQTEHKPDPVDLSIPEDILKKHFKIFPFLGAEEEENIKEEGEVHV